MEAYGDYIELQAQGVELMEFIETQSEEDDEENDDQDNSTEEK